MCKYTPIFRYMMVFNQNCKPDKKFVLFMKNGTFHTCRDKSVVNNNSKYMIVKYQYAYELTE